ncbi:MAG: phospho-sugar mutase [Deltaproteobacteria bacterium]|nr:phospho-sugar mutase [Deltaproteobacteria bacterium]
MKSYAELEAAAEAWLLEDPDPKTRAELRALLEARDQDGLWQRFSGPLEFGTAGLRGLLGAGPHRMNRVVVQRATAGLVAYLLEQLPEARERGVAIGYDGRRMSEVFARDAAEVVAGAGVLARVFPHVAPTPLVGFAVLDQGAAAGIVITASHNPPDYNGYKVFWGNGAQIIPPHDEGIAKRIAAVGALAELPRMARAEAEARGLYQSLDEALERRYLDRVRGMGLEPDVPKDIGIAYTALHGVGAPYTETALREAGFERVASVAAQREPDGEFPTVSFPNPEEDGALDMVLALADEHGADLILANDPDADRLAVAARDASGEMQRLSGNETGCLLAHYLLERGPARDKPFVLSSLVSSPMLGVIAEAHGAHWEETLTGHKWIQNRALELEAEGGTFVLGYEEALGYGVGNLVRDKDGVSAARVMAELAAYYKSKGGGVIAELENMARRYGLFMSRQVSLVLPGDDGADRIRNIMQAARDDGPWRVAGHDVLTQWDLMDRRRLDRAGKYTRTQLPRSLVMCFPLEGGHRIMLRPSGTEPKLKYYFDVRVELEASESMADARQRGEALMDELEGKFRGRFEQGRCPD